MGVFLVLIPIAFAVAGALNSRKTSRQQELGSFLLETRFKDSELLREALDSYGCKAVAQDGEVTSAIDGARILFQLNEQETLDAVFYGNIPFHHAESFISDLTDEYTRVLQNRVYHRLLSRAKERGLLLESEEVHDDSSIVLTFALQESSG
jgi:hypothetical protein